MNGGLRSRKRRASSEDVNPLEGAINIVDAMLVFACGLMLALIMHWNVDLGSNSSGLSQSGQRVDLKQGKDLSQVPQIRKDLVETQGKGKSYEEMGTVYRDPATGKLFMLTQQ